MVARQLISLAIALGSKHVLAWSNDSYPPLPPTGESTVVPYTPAANSSSWITARGGKLYLDGVDYTFATFNNPELIGAVQPELDDILASLTAFGRPITRTYTLGVTSINVDNSSAFIQGWNSSADNWIFNEDEFVKYDMMLDRARYWGVRVVTPLINQDYGSQSTNYAGNWADLIRMYYGLPDYNATKSYNFWTDPALIAATKKIYEYFLTRTNTINGIVYGQDETFWALETGNELNYNMTVAPDNDQTRPPPGNWTVTIAELIKSLAPNMLVLDGSLSRNNMTDEKWAQEALTSPHVDLFSEHYYGATPGAYDYTDMVNDSAYINSYGKTFIIGEHGFYNETTQWDNFYYLMARNPVAGAMVWSMRPHAANGGFETHGEGGGIFSYHIPGWSPPAAPDFDPLEEYIVHKTFQASFTIVGESIPWYPVPRAPTILSYNQTSNTTVMPFRGGAWGEHYEVFAATTDGWNQIINYAYDNVDAGMANFTVDALNGTFVMRGVSVNEQNGPWSNVFTVE